MAFDFQLRERGGNQGVFEHELRREVFQMVYKNEVQELLKKYHDGFKQATFLYGSANVGKSSVSKNLKSFTKDFVFNIDCQQINSQIQGNGVEAIKCGEQFLRMHYERAVSYSDRSDVILILDNLNAICSLISKDDG